MKKIVLELDVRDDDLDSLNASLNKTEANFKDVDQAAKKTSKSVDDVAGNGGAIAILDSLTGGLATRMRDAFEATKLFNFSLKGTRTALIATGIGLFVVILGAVVVLWDDIVEAIEQVNKKLLEQIELSRQIQEGISAEINLLDKKILLTEKQGKGNEELQKQRLNLVKLLQEENVHELGLLNKRATNLKLSSLELNTREKIVRAALNLLQAGSGDAFILSKQVEQSKEYLDLLTEITNLEADIVDGEIKIFDLENPEGDGTVAREKQTSIGDAGLTPQDAVKLTSAQMLSDALKDISADSLRDANLKLQQGVLAEQNAADEKRRIAELENEQKLMLASNTLGQLANLFAANSKAAKIAGSAQALINTYLGVTQVLSNKTVLPEPFGTINKIASIATVLASGFKAVKQINSVKVPSGGGGGGGSVQSGGGGFGGGSIPSPEFNVVGDTGINQLGQTIEDGLGRPQRSYVVFGDIEKGQRIQDNSIRESTV
tara:strand:- start:9112 stop:10581 length:1470 start_codon:yes stop_codon:yes gene_type:complete